MTGSSPPADLALPPPTAVLDEISEHITKATLEPWGLATGAQLLADTEALLLLSDRLDALRLTVVAALDRTDEAARRGHRNTGAMLKCRSTNRHAPKVGRDVHLGGRLLHMPASTEAFRAGEITIDHVRLLSTCLDPRFDDAFGESEAMLVGFATELGWSGFARAINRWKDAADGGEPDLREERDLAARELHLSRTFHDRGALSGTLTPHARQTFGAELERLTDELWRQDWSDAIDRVGEANVTIDALGRTHAQRRHDALLLMAERSAGANGGRPEPIVYVHCTVDELERALTETTDAETEGEPTAPTSERLDFADRPHPSPIAAAAGSSLREYEDHTPLTRRMLARLAIRAVIKRVVWAPGGRIIDISPGARLFSRRQREAIAVRDRVCACGCGLSARRCEADHVIEVRDGGLTVVANGKPQCGRSHKLKTNARNRSGPASPT